MLLSLGPRYLLSDRSASGEPGRSWGVSGMGIPRWGAQRIGRGLVGPMKPLPIGARYFCGDGYDKAHEEACAYGHKAGPSKAEYQEAITAHYTDEHPDLHYPIDQDALDKYVLEAAKKQAQKAQAKVLLEMAKKGAAKVEGGDDLSGTIPRVTRPRELPDFTEFDFPDADVADAGVEEIELDQLISIAARQGRRLIGVEIQNVSREVGIEMVTLAADNSLEMQLELNTRTGAQNLDDPENLWRYTMNTGWVEGTAGAAASGVFVEVNDPHAAVYVAPRLFWRFTNNLDRQVDTGDLFVRIGTVSQRLSTFLLFELLEQFSGLFGLT